MGRQVLSRSRKKSWLETWRGLSSVQLVSDTSCPPGCAAGEAASLNTSAMLSAFSVAFRSSSRPSSSRRYGLQRSAMLVPSSSRTSSPSALSLSMFDVVVAAPAAAPAGEPAAVPRRIEVAVPVACLKPTAAATYVDMLLSIALPVVAQVPGTSTLVHARSFLAYSSFIYQPTTNTTSSPATGADANTLPGSPS